MVITGTQPTKRRQVFATSTSKPELSLVNEYTKARVGVEQPKTSMDRPRQQPRKPFLLLVIANRYNQGFSLIDEHDQLHASGSAGVNEVSLQEQILLACQWRHDRRDAPYRVFFRGGKRYTGTIKIVSRDSAAKLLSFRLDVRNRTCPLKLARNSRLSWLKWRPAFPG